MPIAQYKLNEMEAALQGPIDVLICSASYEQRCRSIPESVSQTSVGRVIVVEYANRQVLHGGNAAIIQQRFAGKSQLVFIDRADPLKTADALREMTKTISPSSKVVVDITTFTHESLLILVNLLWQDLDVTRVQFVYASAAEYSLGDPIGKKWLSKGIGDVRSVLGYPGEFVPSKKLHLIILAGFEYERAIELIRAYEPSIVSLGYGHGASQHNLSSKISVSMVRSIVGTAREFQFDCYDPYATQRAIDEQIQAVPDCNVVIAPLNTKVSTMGAALVGLLNERVQLCYARALLYNYKHYSSPGDYGYLFSVERRTHSSSQT